MKIRIVSKIHFNKILLDNKIDNKNIKTATPNTCYISINNSDTEYDESYLTQLPIHSNGENVLNLVFDDVNPMDMPKGMVGVDGIQEMTADQAEQIIQFIDKNKNKDGCLIHCSAGVSRSGAVGTFINDYLQQDYLEFKKLNPHIHPNPYVIKLLRDAINNKKTGK